MLKLSQRPRPTPSASEHLSASDPGSKTTAASGTQLGVAWINGAFSAVVVQRGQRLGAWSSPIPIPDIGGLTQAFKTALSELRFTGSHVSLVLAHSKLTQRFVEVPVGANAAAERVLQRQIEQGKPFEGAARWVVQATLPTKTAGGAMVHLLPHSFLDELATAAQKAGLHLGVVVPASEAVRQLSQSVSGPREDIHLFAAALPASTLLVLTNGAGEPLLVRSAGENWSQDLSRVATDINRTMLFVQQQFDRPVAQIWLQGTDAPAVASRMEEAVKIAVRPVSAEMDAYFWAGSALQFPGRHPLNLVTREQKEATSRRVVFRFSVVMAAALLLSAVGLSGYVHHLYRLGREQLVALRKEEGELKARHAELQKRHDAVQSRESFLNAVGENRQRPVPTWFLGYLSEALPPELWVTNLVTRRHGATWQIQLAGQLQPALLQRGESNALPAWSRLTNTLATGPFHLKLQEPAPPAGEAGQGSSWANRMRDGQAHRSRPQVAFSLHGSLP